MRLPRHQVVPLLPLLLVACSSSGLSAPTSDPIAPIKASTDVTDIGSTVAASPIDAGAPSTTSTPPSSTNIPADYVPTPGGWSHPSCIHPIPRGGHVDQLGNVIGADGSIAWEIQPCLYPRLSNSGTVLAEPVTEVNKAGIAPRPMISPQPCTVPPIDGYGTWDEGAVQCAPTSGTGMFDGIQSYLIVPPAPTDQTNDSLTLFYWSGLPDSLAGYYTLLQVVLQWGISGDNTNGATIGYAPHGPWVAAVWYVSGAYTYPASQTVVNVGDTILASIAATSDLGGGAYQWDALAYDLNTHGDSSTFANSQPQGPLSLAEAAVFEGYNVSNCNQVPYNYMNVTTVDLVSGTPDWNSSAPTPNGFTRFVQPGNTSLPGEPGNICGWAVGTNNSTVTLWQ